MALRQLEALGLSRRAVAHRAAAGRLHRVHRGIYAVGHRLLGRHGQYMAAVLACGPAAALSHAAAADLWSIRRSNAAKVDLIVPTPGGRSRPGLRIHRHPSLRDHEVTTHDRIPVTTPARTILDLAATLQPHRLERVLDQAEILELTDCQDHGLPPPKVNERVAGKEVDFLFAAERLIVETDGWQFHRTRRAFERDRARDALLLTRGFRTVRVTHEALKRDPASVAATIATVLAA